jgi:hypothetical protein
MRFPMYLRARRSDAEIEESLAVARRILAPDPDRPGGGEPMLEYYRSCLDVLDQKTVSLLTVTSIAIAISTVALTQPAFQPHVLDQTVRWIAIVSMVFEVVTMWLLLRAAWAYWVEEDPKGVPHGGAGVDTVVVRLVRARAQRTALYYRSWYTSYVFLVCVLAIAAVSVWVRISDVPPNRKVSERLELVPGRASTEAVSRKLIDASAYCRAALDVIGVGAKAPAISLDGRSDADPDAPWLQESPTSAPRMSNGAWHYDLSVDHPTLRLVVHGRPGQDLGHLEVLLTLIPCGGGD